MQKLKLFVLKKYGPLLFLLKIKTNNFLPSKIVFISNALSVGWILDRSDNLIVLSPAIISFKKTISYC